MAKMRSHNQRVRAVQTRGPGAPGVGGHGELTDTSGKWKSPKPKSTLPAPKKMNTSVGEALAAAAKRKEEKGREK